MKKTILASVVILAIALWNVVAFAGSTGDLDGDDKVTSADARLALRMSVGLDVCDDALFPSADVDNDREITPADARIILRVSVGLESFHVHAYNKKVLQEPTCTEPGMAQLACECGDVQLTIIPPEGHKPVTDKGREPSCEADGLTEGSHCSVCGAVLISQIPITEGRHIPKTVPGKVPTCTEPGYSESTVCERCGNPRERTYRSRKKSD